MLESTDVSMHSLNINTSLEQLNRDCYEFDEKKSNVENPPPRERLASVRSNVVNNKAKDKLIEVERAEVGKVSKFCTRNHRCCCRRRRRRRRRHHSRYPFN